MTSAEVRERLSTEDDFIFLPRYEYSLKRLLERYPDGVPEKLIAQGLLITEDEVTLVYNRAVRKLQRLMKVH